MVPISHHPTTSCFYDTSSRERGANTALAFQGIEQQLLRILRCTAQAMVSTPGGLVYSPDARPWLEGLVQNHFAANTGGGGGGGERAGVDGLNAVN